MEPKTIRPGTGIGGDGVYGTLGAYALTNKMELVSLTCAHVGIKDQTKAKVGDPRFFYGESYDGSKLIPIKPCNKSLVLEFKGIDLPTTLKKPIEPKKGMKVIKSGFRTNITTGEIIKTDDMVDFPFVFNGEEKLIHFKNIIKTSVMSVM
jgi:hypothetical protein